MRAHIEIQARHFDRLAEKHGLATAKERVAGPRRYRWDLIDRDIHALLNRNRDRLAGKPGTYPEALVSYYASIAIACCQIEGRAPSEELSALIGQLLNVSRFGQRNITDGRLTEARKIRLTEENISNRALAKRIGAAPSTVGRWVDYGLLSAPR